MFRVTTVAAVLGIAACAGPADEPTGPADDSYRMTVEESDTAFRGALETPDGAISFASTDLGDGVYDLYIETNGLRVAGLFDPTTGVIELDGYTAADGSNTQITADDRSQFLAVARALDVYGNDAPVHISLLQSYADVWAEYPTTMDLQRQVLYAQRGWTSLCGSWGSNVTFKHDCNHGSVGSDATTAKGYVAHTQKFTCSADGTKWKKTSGASYQCLSSEPKGVATWEFAKGNCFARCGAGCGSSRRYTKQCGNHDLCVRSGHATASLYCDDEFSVTLDDAASAPKC